MSTNPPPTGNELPDYYCGRLIYYDQNNAMHWVAYDGQNRVHFPSRKQAEKWCYEQATQSEDAQVDELMRAYYHITRAADILRAATCKYYYTRHVDLEAVSTDLRRHAQRIDDITSQYIK